MADEVCKCLDEEGLVLSRAMDPGNERQQRLRAAINKAYSSFSSSPTSNAQTFSTFQSHLELDFDRHSFPLHLFPVGSQSSSP